MTPYQIELLLHFYCIAAPFPRMDAPAFMGQIEFFQKEDLIRTPTNIDRPQLTDRGEAYIRFLCEMPLPVCTWSLPATPPGKGD